MKPPKPVRTKTAMSTRSKQAPPPEKLLTETEASEILGCSVRTVRRRIEAGELAVIRDGRLKRIQPDDLRNYIRNRRFG
jgi:excisionase family DNA binding protein